MAPSEAAKLFQKLRLDTSAKAKPAPPAPAVLPSAVEHDSLANNEYYQNNASSEAIPIAVSKREDSAAVVDSVGNEGPYEWPNSAHSTLQRRQRNDSGGLADLRDLESAFKNRPTAISFADKVTLDSGNEVAMSSPLPKTEIRPRQRGRSILQEMAMKEQARSKRTHSESKRDKYDPHTGQPLDRWTDDRMQFHAGDRRHPLLQSTVDDLARQSDLSVQDPVVSLTSDATISPVLEEARTPRTPLDHDFLQSPIQQSPIPPSSSPIGFTSSQLPFGRRTSSQRSFSRSLRSENLSQHGSMRRASRRTSTRSLNNSSKSPAGQFLSMLTAREEPEAAPEPDDEGQEIDQTGYIIGAQVGVGGFSVVKEVFSLEQGQRVKRAVKIVRKQVVGKDEEENEKLQTEFEHEVSIWRYLKHPNVLPLLAVYDSPFATFCITNYNVGGTLFDLVHSRRQKNLGGLPGSLAKRYTWQLASAIQYLHEEIRVVHRDIKLENVLLDMSSPTAESTGGNILLCDFGMADYIYNENRSSPEPYPEDDASGNRTGNIGPGQTSTSVTGSLRYAAPEMFNTDGRQIYSTAADIWAFGNVVYALLTNKLAFDDPFEPRVVMSIMAGEWDKKALLGAPAVQEEGGEGAIELVKGCLQKAPGRRMTISDILNCRWLRGCEGLYDTACEWAST